MGRALWCSRTSPTARRFSPKARRLRQKANLKLVVVDYLQLMTSGKKVESRQIEVSEFSRHLKLLAKELEVPVVAIQGPAAVPADAGRGPLEYSMDVTAWEVWARGDQATGWALVTSKLTEPAVSASVPEKEGAALSPATPPPI